MLTHCLNSDVSDAGSVCLWGSVSTPLKMNGYLQADWLRAGGSVVKKSAWWVGKIPWRRKWQSTLAFLAGESHGQRSLQGYSPWGSKTSDTTELQQSQHAVQSLHPECSDGKHRDHILLSGAGSDGEDGRGRGRDTSLTKLCIFKAISQCLKIKCNQQYLIKLLFPHLFPMSTIVLF